MRYTKRDLQRAIEHIVCYTVNDISLRTEQVSKFLDKESKVIPGQNDIETSFREIMADDYSALMQRYAVNLQPLFPYIEKELPQVKKHIEPLKVLYQQILDRGNFKNGCNCIGCRKYKSEKEK